MLASRLRKSIHSGCSRAGSDQKLRAINIVLNGSMPSGRVSSAARACSSARSLSPRARSAAARTAGLTWRPALER